MATITTSWTTYASKKWSTSGLSVTFQLQARYTGQSIANNTTTIQTRLRTVLNSGGGGGYPYKFTCSYCSTVSGSSIWHFATENITTSSSKTISHNSDGTKTVSLSASASVTGLGLSVSLSASVGMPTIPRSAKITAAPNFTDLDNPTITYSNPAGNAVTTLQASIFMPDGLIGLASYRDISKTGSSYTFNLTEEERERLRTNCVNSKSTAVRFYIMTVLGGNTYKQYLERTLTITNANPTFTATYEDTNASSIAITGDNQLLIQNQSTLQINVANATAYKYATLSSITATINGVTYNGTLNGSNATINVGALNIAENTDVIVTLTDSRGYTATQTLNLQFLGWQLPTANITLQRQNNFYSQTDITVDANYSSLDNQNTITIQARYKKTTDSTYSSYVTLQDDVMTTLNLDNLYEWDVQVVLTDRLGSTTYNLTLDKGMPIIYFDRLKRSVGINCFPNDDESLEITEGNNQLNVGEELSKIDANIITIGLTSNTSVSIGSKWTHYVLGLNNLTASLGSKLTFNSSTHRIVVGDGVSYVKANAFGLFRGITGSIEFNIRKNGTTIGSTSVQTSNTSTFWNGAITDILVPVSSGDYFDITFRASATGTITAVGEGSTKITVEVVK